MFFSDGCYVTSYDENEIGNCPSWSDLDVETQYKWLKTYCTLDHKLEKGDIYIPNGLNQMSSTGYTQTYILTDLFFFEMTSAFVIPSTSIVRIVHWRPDVWYIKRALGEILAVGKNRHF